MTKWKMVPAEPTLEMQAAAWNVADDCVDFYDYGGWTGAGYTMEDRVGKDVYTAMLAAAPPPGGDVVEEIAIAIFDANHAPMSSLKWAHAATPKARYRKQARAVISVLTRER